MKVSCRTSAGCTESRRCSRVRHDGHHEAWPGSRPYPEQVLDNFGIKQTASGEPFPVYEGAPIDA